MNEPRVSNPVPIEQIADLLPQYLAERAAEGVPAARLARLQVGITTTLRRARAAGYALTDLSAACLGNLGNECYRKWAAAFLRWASRHGLHVHADFAAPVVAPEAEALLTAFQASRTCRSSQAASARLALARLGCAGISTDPAQLERPQAEAVLTGSVRDLVTVLRWGTAQGF